MAVKNKNKNIFKKRERKLRSLFSQLRKTETATNWFLGVLEGASIYNSQLYRSVVRILRDTIRLWGTL